MDRQFDLGQDVFEECQGVADLPVVDPANWNPIFDPAEFNNTHSPLKVEKYRLSQD